MASVASQADAKLALAMRALCWAAHGQGPKMASNADAKLGLAMRALCWASPRPCGPCAGPAMRALSGLKLAAGWGRLLMATFSNRSKIEPKMRQKEWGIARAWGWPAAWLVAGRGAGRGGWPLGWLGWPAASLFCIQPD